MANKDMRLAIRIAGEIDKSLGDSLNMTKKEIRALAIEAARAGKDPTLSGAIDQMSGGTESLTNRAIQFTKVIAGAAVGAGAAIGGLGAASIQAGSEFESAFAGIRKTVDATEDEYEALEDSIRAMAKDMPMTAANLSEIGEAAGQLGIHTENLEEFIKTMADLSVATNLTSDEAATEFAKFANITGMEQDQFDELGSTVVALGNNMATTEADIVSMAMRLAGAGTQIKMSEADIMGFSAALSSVGIEAEMGGSALSKIMVDMQLAVETGKGRLEDYAKVTGITTKEFQKLFKANPAEAITGFLSGLNDTDRLGQSAIATLDEMEISEVRLRDTLLRAASASDLFGDSLDLANEAYEENTALTREAEQRYATFESRTEMLKNRVTDAGISIYQNFRDPLNDLLGLALDETEDLSILDEDTIAEMAASLQEHIPTIVREVKEGANAFSDFAGPMVGTVVDNLDLIGSGITGIGTTLVALNVAKKVNELSKAFGTMKVAALGNPITLWVAGISAGIGVFAAVRTQLKKTREEAARANLYEHFGDIALSLEEIDEAARQIVDNGKLDKLDAAMEELGKTSDIAKDIREASGEIEKITWKIGMGFDLSDTDQDTLKSSIESMVADAMSLVDQSNYTAAINVQALFGEDSFAGDALITGFNAMYSEIGAEVEALGKQLGDAYSKAMEDGILDVDEAEIINELQGKLAKVTSEVSNSQFEAKLQRIALENSGADLTAESFQNLQSEVQEVIDEQKANQAQSYDYAMSQLNLQRERSASGEISPESSAYLSEETYQARAEALNRQYQAQQMELDSRGLDFSVDSIGDAYQAELGALDDLIQANLPQTLKDTMTMLEEGNSLSAFDPKTIRRSLGIGELDRETTVAIKDLLDGAMQEQFSGLQEMARQAQQEGKAIPEAVVKGLTDAAVIGAIAGDSEAIWQLMTTAAMGNEEYAEALKTAEENGMKLPESISAGIESNWDVISTTIDRTHNFIQREMDNVFAKGINADLDVYYSLNPLVTNAPSTKEMVEAASGKKWTNVGVLAHADGGILSTPHLGLVAEAGPEAIIPLDKSNRAKSIWEEAGEILGVLPSSSNSKTGGTGESGEGNTYITITYSPTLQGASQRELEEAARTSYEEFERNLSRFLKTRDRVRL